MIWIKIADWSSRPASCLETTGHCPGRIALGGQVVLASGAPAGSVTVP
jgi:hypothetical protein